MFNSSNSLSLSKITGTFLILVFFTSLKTSFFLTFNEYLLAGLLGAGLFFSVLITKYKIETWNACSSIAAVLFTFSALLGQRGNVNAYIGIFILIFPLIMFWGFKDKYKLSFLKLLDTVLAITIFISLCTWILFLINVPLPHYSMDWNFYNFDNYFTFIYIPSTFYAFPRYQFLFTEPGYFGCLMVFMIFIRKYNFKQWQTIVYFVALILTYSMAGYLLFFVGLIPFIIANKRNRFKYLLALLLLLFVFLYLALIDQDNVVSKMFAYRLQIENGQISGYNRNNTDFDYYWQNIFLSRGDILWGNNEEISLIYKDGDLFGVDLRAYICRFGIVPLIFYFGSLLLYFKRYTSKMGLWYLLLFIIFYYRGYTPMYYIGFSMLLVAGLVKFHNEAKVVCNPK